MRLYMNSEQVKLGQRWLYSVSGYCDCVILEKITKIVQPMSRLRLLNSDISITSLWC